MVEKTLESLTAGALYCILTGEENDGLIISGRQKVRDLVSPHSSVSELTSLLQRNKPLQKDISDLLREEFHLEVLAGKEAHSVAAFRQFVPCLSDYLREAGIVSPAYDREFIEQTYSSAAYPSFFELDQRFPRQQSTWQLKVDLPSQSPVTVEVRPLTHLEELRPFRDLYTTSFCYFNSTINIAQLYLYAAHQSVQMLGVWDMNEKNPQPVGLIPLLFMEANPSPQIQKVPYLYAEAAMLKDEFADAKVRTSTGLVPFYDALLDIIAVFAGLQQSKPFPVIGSCRKDDAGYSPTVRKGIEAAAQRWKWYCVQNRIGQRDFPDVLNLRPRKGTDPRFECSMYMELPEDQRLLTYLQQHGYRFSTTLLNSHAFLNEEELQKERSLPLQKRAILYKEWGEMKGWTSFIPIPEYYEIQREFLPALRRTA